MLTLNASLSYVDFSKTPLHNGVMGTKMNERIKAARTSAGLRQEDVAEQLEVSRPAITQWEGDGEKRTVPSLGNLIAFAKLVCQRTGASVATVSGWIIDDASTCPPPWTEPPPTGGGQLDKSAFVLDEAVMLHAEMIVDVFISLESKRAISAKWRARMLFETYLSLALFDESGEAISQRLRQILMQSAKR